MSIAIVSTQLNGFSYCYLKLIILLNTIHSFVKWFQVLLCIINNPIKHQSFVYTQLNDQIVLFLTIQFSISHFVCTQFKCQTVLFDP